MRFYSSLLLLLSVCCRSSMTIEIFQQKGLEKQFSLNRMSSSSIASAAAFSWPIKANQKFEFRKSKTISSENYSRKTFPFVTFMDTKQQRFQERVDARGEKGKQ